MKIFAGGQLYTRNPMEAAATTRFATAQPDWPYQAKTRKKKEDATAASPPASPSIPSMKLYRLSIQTTQNPPGTTHAHPGNTHFPKKTSGRGGVRKPNISEAEAN